MIALIGCVKSKKKNICKAKDMYISPLFRKSLNYASKTCSNIYILSAKYGLLRMDDIISPYNETLNQKTEHEKRFGQQRFIGKCKKKE